MKNNVKAIQELMVKYNEYLEKWVSEYGTKDGFNEWFTKQVKR